MFGIGLHLARFAQPPSAFLKANDALVDLFSSTLIGAILLVPRQYSSENSRVITMAEFSLSNCSGETHESRPSQLFGLTSSNYTTLQTSRSCEQVTNIQYSSAVTLIPNLASLRLSAASIQLWSSYPYSSTQASIPPAVQFDGSPALVAHHTLFGDGFDVDARILLKKLEALFVHLAHLCSWELSWLDKTPQKRLSQLRGVEQGFARVRISNSSSFASGWEETRQTYLLRSDTCSSSLLLSSSKSTELLRTESDMAHGQSILEPLSPGTTYILVARFSGMLLREKSTYVDKSESLLYQVVNGGYGLTRWDISIPTISFDGLIDRRGALHAVAAGKTRSSNLVCLELPVCSEVMCPPRNEND
ncbi:uncharacterized protein BT62DRAFT_1014065 [Guyanagaster necrorhizus]|uniref:Uncharacterized protein n=1 Tax=Guyanagaster necrorhizus TaxID=856835 RepID=A0A9P8ALY7_9AGAR|nr:uncharacterized protein BT62DRAFT_1014065 [Guyanagaster necrorhizus MCA 3950]KAG7439327.1 hypothetical protein BT62DRAFT_1014065 [Guyanagaster necrorhizus MCA 3950]